VRPIIRPRARRPVGPHAGSVTDDDGDKRQPAKQYWPIRRAINNVKKILIADAFIEKYQHANVKVRSALSVQISSVIECNIVKPCAALVGNNLEQLSAFVGLSL